MIYDSAYLQAHDYDLILSGTLNFSVTGLQSEK